MSGSYDLWKQESREDYEERMGVHAGEEPEDDDTPDDPEYGGDDSHGDAWEGGFCENH